VTVQLGGVLAGGVQVASSTRINCITGPHAAGVVDVVVTNADGQDETLAGGYTYLLPPEVTGVVPASGRMGGGSSVTVNGSGFATSGAVTVRFGGAQATSVVVRSAGELTCVTPSHAAGLVAVTVVNPDGQSDSLENAYTYTGWEGDVAPRSTLGDEQLLAGDLSQMRRFVAGLDSAAAGAEFQRADCAPRATFGNGAISAGDLMQARRYVAGLDSPDGAGGPDQ
jgi:hypothetical protein